MTVQVCIIHSQGTATVLPYGASAPLLTFPSPCLSLHTITFQLSTPEADTAAGITDVSGSLSGSMEFVSDGRDINVIR